MLLSNKELKEKLDCKQDKQVIKWLNARLIRWDRDAKKRPITTLAQIEKHLNNEGDGDEVRF